MALVHETSWSSIGSITAVAGSVGVNTEKFSKSVKSDIDTLLRT